MQGYLSNLLRRGASPISQFKSGARMPGAGELLQRPNSSLAAEMPSPTGAAFGPDWRGEANEIKEYVNQSESAIIGESEAIEPAALPAWQAKHGTIDRLSEHTLSAAKIEPGSFAGTVEETSAHRMREFEKPGTETPVKINEIGKQPKRHPSSEAEKPFFTAGRSSQQISGSPVHEPSSSGHEVSHQVMKDKSMRVQNPSALARPYQQARTGKTEASPPSFGAEQHEALPVRPSATPVNMVQGVAEISPLQNKEMALRGMMSNQNILRQEASSPKLTINRLDIQIINQSPQAKAQPTQHAPAPANAFDAMERLDRHYLGRIYLSV